MIITEPALAIIQDAFAPATALVRHPGRARERRASHPFKSQAYVDGAVSTAKRLDVAAISPTSAIQRRETPLR